MSETIRVWDLFWNHVRVGDDCWEWVADRNQQGYGRFYLRGRPSVVAHRFAYELLVGPIPDGLTLDHLCANKGCVNPAHLDPVTISENKRRALGYPANSESDQHCGRGHEMTPENTYVRHERECRTCRQLRRSDYRHKIARPAAPSDLSGGNTDGSHLSNRDRANA